MSFLGVVIVYQALWVSAESVTVPVMSQSGNDPVIAAAGDIACAPADQSDNTQASECRAAATSDLLLNIPHLTAVLTLGDHQYPDGKIEDFQRSYDKSWGRLKQITHPSMGNHEQAGEGYYAYFGTAAGDPSRGYYSFDLGAWHLIALNSNDACTFVRCDETSAQIDWLRTDLAKNRSACTLAYWHHPRFSSGAHGDHAELGPVWETLYKFGVDVVLTGHDHDYERLSPMNAQGNPNVNNGIRSFIVGTGGKSHYDFGKLRPTSEVRNSDTFGVLKLTLRPRSYDWEFVPEPGKAFTDKGNGRCH